MFAKTTNIYLFTNDGGLILIQRSPTDQNLPLFWETVGGHIDCVVYDTDLADIKLEALREAKEELGVVIPSQAVKYYPEGSNGKHIAWVAHIPTNALDNISLSAEHCAIKVAYRFSDVPKTTRHQVIHFARYALP